MVLCFTAAGVSAIINRSLPTQSQSADQLSDLDKARLEEIHHLKAELGDQVWPGFSQADIPIILYNESYAFLVGYPGQPPDGWINVRSGEVHGGAWEPLPGTSIDGEPYYRTPLPDPDDTPEAFTVRVGERWAASMTTRDWTQIKLASMIRQQLPPAIAAIFPYRIFTGVFNSDWHISAVLHEAFHAYQGSTVRGRLEQAEKILSEPDFPMINQELKEDW